MKMAKYYLVSICLVAAAMTLAIKAVKNKKEASLLASQLTLKQVSQEQSKPVPVNDSTGIAVKQTIEGLALKHKLTLPIVYEKDGRIKIGGLAEKTENVDTRKDGPATAQALQNYNGLIGFLNAVAGLPYLIEYESGCIGVRCESGVTLTLMIKKALVQS